MINKAITITINYILPNVLSYEVRIVYSSSPICFLNINSSSFVTVYCCKKIEFYPSLIFRSNDWFFLAPTHVNWSLFSLAWSDLILNLFITFWDHIWGLKMKVFNTAVQNIDITELQIYFAEQQLVNEIIEKTGRLRFDHCGKSFLILS